MEQALRSLLLASSGVTALVGARIDWGARLQGGDLPALVLHLIGDAERYDLDGRDRLSRGRVQIDCYALTYKAALDLAQAVRAALSGYQGGNFRLIEHAATRSDREGGSDMTDRPFRMIQDYLTHWRAT